MSWDHGDPDPIDILVEHFKDVVYVRTTTRIMVYDYCMYVLVC